MHCRVGVRRFLALQNLHPLSLDKISNALKADFKCLDEDISSLHHITEVVGLNGYAAHNVVIPVWRAVISWCNINIRLKYLRND